MSFGFSFVETSPHSNFDVDSLRELVASAPEPERGAALHALEDEFSAALALADVRKSFREINTGVYPSCFYVTTVHTNTSVTLHPHWIATRYHAFALVCASRGVRREDVPLVSPGRLWVGISPTPCVLSRVVSVIPRAGQPDPTVTLRLFNGTTSLLGVVTESLVTFYDFGIRWGEVNPDVWEIESSERRPGDRRRIQGLEPVLVQFAEGVIYAEAARFRPTEDSTHS
jgi:hypothetical protein